MSLWLPCGLLSCLAEPITVSGIVTVMASLVHVCRLCPQWDVIFADRDPALQLMWLTVWADRWLSVVCGDCVSFGYVSFGRV
jgi:hypothetical protein